MRKALLLLLPACSAALADAVTTKDGVVHTGRILSETEKGYLFRADSGDTSVLDFAQVDEVKRDVPADAPVQPPQPKLSPRAAELRLELDQLHLQQEQLTYAVPITLAVIGAVLGSIGVANLINAADPIRPNAHGAAVLGGLLFVPSAVVLFLRLAKRNDLWHRVADVEKALTLEGRK